MRTIITQNGISVINAEKILVIGIDCNYSDMQNDRYPLVARMGYSEDYDYQCGVYSTGKRALKVLNKLNEWLMIDKSLLDGQVKKQLETGGDAMHMAKSLDAYNNFQMPKDDDDEIDTLMKDAKHFSP